MHPTPVVKEDVPTPYDSSAATDDDKNSHGTSFPPVGPKHANFEASGMIKFTSPFVLHLLILLLLIIYLCTTIPDLDYPVSCPL